MRIAITKTTPGKYALYPEWLRSVDPSCECVDLGAAEDPESALASCGGLLLPGGADVDPEFFGRPEQREECTIDRARDEREFAWIRAALERRLPVLGVCRGLQIMNVALGGTLIIDLPAIGITTHGKRDGQDGMHSVLVRPDTRLAVITGAAEGIVNTAHHQSAGLVPPELEVTAQSPDGVVEALEWKQPEGKPYLLLVQWHPERMDDGGSPFARNIAADFLSAARA